jgi:hypothetical protein
MQQHKYIFVLLFTFFFAAIQAQSTTEIKDPFQFKPSFHQESGFSVFINPYAILPVGSYWGRLNLFEPSSHFSISASCPISLGGSIGTYGGMLGLDVPLTLDLNVGNRATDEADFPIGFFMGAGAGYNLLVGGGYVRSFGPLAHAGLRLTSPLSGRSISLRISYLLGVGGVDVNGNDYNPDVFGLGLFYAM